MKALVTGGAGFIGSNLVNYLIDNGWEVILYDNLSRRGTDENLKWLKKRNKSKKLKVEIKDIRDFKSLKKQVEKADAVFHLAAQVAVTQAIKNPREDFEINALGSLNVLEAAREVKHNPIVIYASTNKVYGSLDGVIYKERKHRYSYRDFPNGIREDHPLNFHSPYGNSKGAADQYTRDYYRIFDVPTVTFRQSCIYGPRQIGIVDQGWMAFLTASALSGKPITFYGNGKQVRDVLYVDDLIEAFLKAVENIDQVNGEIYNIGGGVDNALSLRDFVDILESKIGKEIPVQIAEWRAGDQKVFISDNGKVRKELNWKPKVGLKEGIDKLTTWVGDHLYLF
jgi:CDP-paratose 2-epimerase